jgi:hypothetical protein
MNNIQMNITESSTSRWTTLGSHALLIRRGYRHPSRRAEYGIKNAAFKQKPMQLAASFQMAR